MVPAPTFNCTLVCALMIACYLAGCDNASFTSRGKSFQSSADSAEVQSKADKESEEPPTADPASIISLKITPLNPQMIFSQNLQFKAIAVFDDNKEEDVTDKTEWVSENPTIADFAPTAALGNIRSNDSLAGQAHIVASYLEFSANTDLTVVTPPDRQRLDMIFENPQIASATKRGKLISKIMLKNLRADDTDFTAEQVVQSVDFIFQEIIYGPKVPTAIVGLYDQSIETHNCYKFVPDITSYGGQKIKVSGTDANRNPIVFDINYKIISRPNDASKTAAPTTILIGTEGHPSAIDAGGSCD